MKGRDSSGNSHLISGRPISALFVRRPGAVLAQASIWGRGKAAVLFLLLMTTGAWAKDRKAPPWEKPLQTGRYLYLEHCSVCHEINKAETNKLGPSMFRLFQNEKTPLTGIEPSEAYVKGRIQVGGEIMPPFLGVLNDEEIRLIMEFIRTKK